MNTEVGQVIALVAHGNVFLNGMEEAAPDLLTVNSTFRFVAAVQFSQYADKNQPEGTPVAQSVPTWLSFLRANGVKRLWHIAFAWNRADIAEH